MKKYLLVSGIITSKHDGQEHYITAQRLCQLYKLNPKECIFANDEKDLDGIDFDGLLMLRPREDGNYILKEN